MIILPPTGAVVVVADMSLAMVSVFFNLVVITSIRKRREKEIISVTFNLVSNGNNLFNSVSKCI